MVDATFSMQIFLGSFCYGDIRWHEADMRKDPTKTSKVPTATGRSKQTKVCSEFGVEVCLCGSLGEFSSSCDVGNMFRKEFARVLPICPGLRAACDSNCEGKCFPCVLHCFKYF